MTINKTSLSYTVKPNAQGNATFTIGNDDEGLLKWDAYVATTQHTIATRSVEKAAPGAVSNYKGKLGIKPFAANTLFKTTDYIAGEYPIDFKYYSMIYF